MRLHHPASPASPRATGISTLAVALLLPLLAGSTGGAANAAGTFPLSSCADCNQRGSAAVAGNPQGTFMSAWTGSTTGLTQAALGRFFKVDGTPRGGDVLISAAAPFAGGDVAVAADGSGFFAAAWSRKEGLNSEISLQRFRRTTAPLGNAIPVSVDDSSAIKRDFAPALAFLADGSLMVVWERYGPAYGSSPGSPVEVMARRFDFRTGKPYGPPQKVNTGLVDPGHARVCGTATGAVGVAWTTVNGVFPFQPSLYGAAFRRLTAKGLPTGSELLVAPPVASVGGVALACSSHGFTVAWRSDQLSNGGPGILVRRIAMDSAMGDTVALSEGLDRRVSAPAAFDTARGDSTIAWLADGGATTQVVVRHLGTAGAPGDLTSLGEGPRADAVLQTPALAGIGRAGDFVLVWSGGDGLLGRRVTAGLAPLKMGSSASGLDAPSADR